MKVVFLVLPKGVRGVACSLGLDGRRDRGKPIFIVRDDLLQRAFRRAGRFEALGDMCGTWWVREFGKPSVNGLGLIAESESEILER